MKKITALILTIITALILLLPAISVSADTKGVNVSFTKAVGFTVTIPEDITLNYNDTLDLWSNYDYISVVGAVLANESITVSTDNEATLYDGVGGNYDVGVSLGGSTERTFSSMEVINDTKEPFYVTTADNKMPAGTWAGTMYFYINYNNKDNFQLSSNKVYIGSGTGTQLEISTDTQEDTSLLSLLVINASAEENYSWISSNVGVATVTNEGYVSVTANAKANDRAIISVSNGKNKTSCEIIVTDIQLSVTSVSVESGQDYQLIATVVPAEAQGLLDFSSTVRGVNINSSGLITVDQSVASGTSAMIVITAGKKSNMISLNTFGHTYIGYVAKEASCTETGVRTYTCNSCGHSHDESIPIIGHEYVTSVVNPTCTNSGSTYHTCSECGSTYNEAIAATGHNYSNYLLITPATCTANGISRMYCSNPGCNAYQQFNLSANGHNYVGVMTTAPTCTTKGVVTYTCSTCNDKYTVAAISYNGLHKDADNNGRCDVCAVRLPNMGSPQIFYNILGNVIATSPSYALAVY